MAMAMPTAEKVYGEMLMRARDQELERATKTAVDMVIYQSPILILKSSQLFTQMTPIWSEIRRSEPWRNRVPDLKIVEIYGWVSRNVHARVGKC